MHTYEPTFISSQSGLARAIRAVVGVAIAGLAVAAWGTAGPGNYDRAAPLRVTLPQVTVVGHREAADPARGATVASGCERSQIDGGGTARKLG